MSIATEIQRIQNAKTGIKNFLEANNVQVGDVTIDQYPSKMEELSISGEQYKITDCKYLFYNGARIENIDEVLSLCDVKDLSYMFYNCSDLTNLSLNNLNTSNVTKADSMCQGCSDLQSVDLSNLDTSNIKDMSSMFYGCRKLTDVDVSGFDTRKVTTVSTMFYNCSVLDNLDLSNFYFDKLTLVSNIFANCNALTNLNSFKNLGKGYTVRSNNSSGCRLTLSACTKLTYESLIDVITNGLYDLNLTYDVAGGGTLYTQSLVLGSLNMAKLTADEIAVATNKGWVVS